MNLFNRMGGIISARLYPISDVEFCFVRHGLTYLLANESKAVELPVITFRSVCENDAEMKGSGVYYTTNLALPIKNKPATLEGCLQCGCIAVVTSPSGCRWVFGSEKCPLLGHCTPKLGTSPADGNHYLVVLESSDNVQVCPLVD